MASTEDVEDGRPGFGHRAFGYREGNLELHPVEAAAIREAYEAVLHHSTSPAEVARAWNLQGLRTPFGNVWQGEKVKRLLIRKRNAAIVVHAGVERDDIEAAWQPLVNRTTFDATVTVLKQRTRAGYRRVTSTPVYLSTGIAQCATCGSALKIASVSSAQAARGVMFGCPQRGRTLSRLDHAVIHIEPIEEAVHEAVVAALQDAPADLDENELQHITTSIGSLVQERRDVLASLREPDLGLRMDDLKPRLRDIEEYLQRLEVDRADVLRRADMLKVRSDDSSTAANRFDALPIRGRRSLVAALLFIKVNPPGVVPALKIARRV